MFCALILLSYVKSSIYNTVDIKYKTSSDNPESVTELSDFSTLKSFDMDPTKKVSDKNYTQY